MAKQAPGAAWARLITRRLGALSRKALRDGTRTAARAVQQATKAALATKPAKPAKPVKPAKPTKARKPVAAKLLRPAARRRGLGAASDPGAGGAGSWTTGIALAATGARRYALFKPAGVARTERLPLLVMLHGCTQDAAGFARSTGIHRLAARERCLVLYPEQDRLAQPQGCWNWYDTRNGRAQAEAAVLLRAIDQVCASQPVDPARVVVAGLSAGASMAALLVTLQPRRFSALVMHSGIAPGTADSTLSALRAMQGRRGTAPLDADAAAMASDWPPLLVIQGAQDNVVAPANGAAAAQAWATAAGAVARPARTVQRGQRLAMTVTDYTAGRRCVATLVSVAGLGHAWSGGAAGQPFSDPAGPDASRLLWAFAARRFRDMQHTPAPAPARTPGRGGRPASGRP